MEELKRDSPEVSQLAQKAGLTMIQHAWRESKTIHIQTPYGVFTPAPARNKADTSPKPAKGKSFTDIPFVGPEIAHSLRQAGYHTLADLAQANANDLTAIPHVTSRTVREIQKFTGGNRG